MNRNFNDWLSKFKASISDYTYYVDFEKIYKNVDKVKVELNILNSLIGSKNIEEEFSIRRSTVSKTLRLMEEKDYIKRESVDVDARLRKISLTPKALHIADFIESDMQKLQDIAFNGISDSDLEVIFRVAVKVRENIENALGSH